MKKIQAKLFLAWHLMKHIFRSLPHLFSPRESQYGKFIANYARVEPLWFPTPEERAHFDKFSQCIHCGLCALDCRMLNEQPELEFHPSWVALTVSRYSPDLGYSQSVADVCHRCPGCTVYCPTLVPIKPMAEFIINKVRQWKNNSKESH